MLVNLDSPAFLAEVHTALAAGPAVQPIEVTGPDGCARLTILWRELPRKVAAVLVIIAGVLFLMVSPTAPSAAGHATQLLREAAAAQQSEPSEQNPLPRPRKPRRTTTPPEERPVARRDDDDRRNGQPIIAL